MRRRRQSADLLAVMPPHLALFDTELWCADGSTVAGGQTRWDAEVANWCAEAGRDTIVLIERLALVDGTIGYPSLHR